MKTVMMRDELVEGVNWFPTRDAQVVPAGGCAPQSKAAASLLKGMAQAARERKEARIMDKLDRAIELIERSRAMRNRPIPDAPNAGPTAGELMSQYQPSFADMSRVSAEDMARRCAESQSAYAARNPHKKKEEAK